MKSQIARSTLINLWRKQPLTDGLPRNPSPQELMINNASNQLSSKTDVQLAPWKAKLTSMMSFPAQMISLSGFRIPLSAVRAPPMQAHRFRHCTVRRTMGQWQGCAENQVSSAQKTARQLFHPHQGSPGPSVSVPLPARWHILRRQYPLYYLHGGMPWVWKSFSVWTQTLKQV